MSEELTGKTVWRDYSKGWKCETVKMGRGGSEYVPRANQQQAEMEKFINALLMLLPSDRRRTALEIGLDQGGTHLIWKMIFEKVVSIELDVRASMVFAGGMRDRKGSLVICSNSHLPYTRELVKKELASDSVDFLFIDADHSFSSVESDYMNYEPLVVSGGVIGFHDYKSHPGVRDFLDMVRDGKHPMIPAVEIQHILDANTGISYYIKP